MNISFEEPFVPFQIEDMKAISQLWNGKVLSDLHKYMKEENNLSPMDKNIEKQK